MGFRTIYKNGLTKLNQNILSIGFDEILDYTICEDGKSIWLGAIFWRNV